MAGSTPAFADVPARTWRLFASSVLDLIIIVLVVTPSPSGVWPVISRGLWSCH